MSKLFDFSAEIQRIKILKTRAKIHPEAMGSLYSSGNIPTAIMTEGVEIDFKEIRALGDKTLAHDNQRIVVYIRDYRSYNIGYDLPRFHVAMCQTLKEMINNNRKHRYVETQREDGIFVLYKDGDEDKRTEERLYVCKHCLSALNYYGYTENVANKEKIARQFSLVEYFIQYPKDLLKDQCFGSAALARPNRYPTNWQTISYQCRQQAGWCCQKCAIDLSRHRKYLHTHHKDGHKGNNAPSNLIALCIACHAEEYNHGHMKDMATYHEFLAWRRTRT